MRGYQRLPAVRLGALSGGITDKRGDPSTPVFFALAAAAAALILSLTADLEFFLDEWSVLTRPGWDADTLLEPHNEHPYLIPIVIYKVLLELFGMESTLPFQLVNVALLVCVAGLTMVLVRRRLGSVPALIAAALLLTLGAAWETLLWPIAMGFLGSLACGLGVLIALDRERPRDALVCVLLVAGISFSSVGLLFIAGAAVDLALRPTGAPWRERLRRGWVVAIPLVLAAAWYLGYGRDAESAASLANLAGIPVYAMNAAATAIASLSGLVSVDPANSGAVSGTSWGRVLLVAALFGAGVLIARDRGVLSRRLWVLGAIALTFWALAGLNAVPGREPGASRFQLVGGALILLIAAELLRGRRAGRAAGWAAAGVALVIIASNVVALRDGRRFLLGVSETARAELSALELVGTQVDRALALTPEVAGAPHLGTVVAGPYLDAVASFGSPVEVPGDLEAASEENRERADGVLATALGLALEPATGPGGDCRSLAAGGEAEVGPGELLIDPRAEAGVRVGRFADVAAVELGRTAGLTALTIPPDDSEVPWRIAVDGDVELCAAR